MLHLSTRWDFVSLRKLALKSITPPTPHDQLVLARTYAVDQWVLPALTALSERPQPLSLDEAQKMSMEDVVLVAAAREEFRAGALPSRVDADDAGKLPNMETEGTETMSSLGLQHVGSTKEDESVVEHSVSSLQVFLAIQCR